MNMRNTVAGLFVTCALALMTSCLFMLDVSRDPRYQMGATVGQRYRLLQPVQLYGWRWETGFLGSNLTRYDPGPFGYLEAYKILQTGTVVRIMRLEYEHHPENGLSVEPYAKIETGIYMGRIVSLGDTTYTIDLTNHPPKLVTVRIPEKAFWELIKDGP